MNRWRRAAVSGPMDNYIRRTQTELDELVGSWRDDPCFDLEDAPGFEAHREELMRIRLKVDAEQASRAAREHEAAITKLMRVALASLRRATSDAEHLRLQDEIDGVRKAVRAL